MGLVCFLVGGTGTLRLEHDGFDVPQVFFVWKIGRKVFSLFVKRSEIFVQT